ncbi:LamG-like jellyroll fold domain-containing protein [Fibrella forsythiae]|uniref:DUF1080 domain-containing protein n=1 Tax=Fibrella forsythiae TaxID=2817061 RepID=A0ABS3JDY9_9BACT|nr:hypothetical protein [Fibrella forsythiae]MBO0948214.1 hypothetical protein [Fibrella forsythiae]
MRYLLLYSFLLLPAFVIGQTQKAPVTSSASDWVTLTITGTDTVATSTAKTKSAKPTRSKPAVSTATDSKTSLAAAGAKTPAKKSAATATPTRSATALATNKSAASRAFLETFADNHNGWLTGKRNGFDLEIAKDSYYIRKQKTDSNRPGRSYIKLPDDLNLNKSDTFTVSVEMVIPPNVEPDGGLLIGVKDTSNYCQFRVIGTSKVALYTRVNGTAQANYMVGKPTAAKVTISPTRNTLTVRRTGNELHFYINGREVEDSPHPYRPFKGNGVGFISFAEAVKYQYLTVQLGK